MMRKTFLTISASAYILTGCSNKAVETDTTALETAATQAQTPEVDKTYLTNDPGPGMLTPEILFSDASLSGTSLRGAKIAPDGSFVTVLQGREDNVNQQDLWAYDFESGEERLLVSSTDILGAPEELSLEEKNRRERRREYGSGIVSYDWAGDSLLLFPLGGDIYLYDLETKEARQVTATKGFETDPKVFGKGQYVAYIRENNLYVKDLKSGLERQLSDGATELVRNGIASFVVQEELNCRIGRTRKRIALLNIGYACRCIFNTVTRFNIRIISLSIGDASRVRTAPIARITVKLFLDDKTSNTVANKLRRAVRELPLQT